MKIIDFRARPNTKEFMSMYSGPTKAGVWKKFGYPEVPTETLEQFLVALNRNCIDKAVFSGRQVTAYGEIVRGFPNDFVAECVKSSGEKIIGFAGIDLKAGTTAVRELDRSVHNLGLRGVSIDLDTFSVYPDDRMMYPIYEKAMELDIIVSFTMGPLVGRYADPLLVDRVAEDFPGLTIVCSHGCYPQVTEFISLAYRRDNVYLEASIYEFLPGAEPFIAAANGFIQDQVIYASAFPFNPLETASKFQKLPFDQGALEKVMYKNAARILKLE